MGCDIDKIRDTEETKNISIHAPAWGATTSLVDFLLPSPISIHAPAWGATRSHIRFSKVALFQSTHPHGVRRGLQGIEAFCTAFQSTHPHGVRLAL